MEAMQKKTDANEAATKALLRIAEALHIEGHELAAICGVSASKISGFRHGKQWLRVDAPDAERALYFIRVAQLLYALVGAHNDAAAIEWLNNSNTYFDKAPLDAMKSIEGLVNVKQYLEAMRGQ